MYQIVGLVTLAIVLPMIVTSYIRLCTRSPPPPPSAFSGIKQLPALLKGESKIHVISAILTQLTLGISMFAWVQGFSLLRIVSLCVVDAILDAPLVVAAISFLSMAQIGSTVIVFVRQYFEMRIAKLGTPSAITETLSDPEKRMSEIKTKETVIVMKRSCDSATGSPVSPRSIPRPRQQPTSFNGGKNPQFGWPAEVRKFGSAERVVPSALRSNPISPHFYSSAISDRVASPRLYERKFSAFDEELSVFTPTLVPPEYTSPRMDRKGSTFTVGKTQTESEADVSVHGSMRADSEVEVVRIWRENEYELSRSSSKRSAGDESPTIGLLRYYQNSTGRGVSEAQSVEELEELRLRLMKVSE
jgi:hypothetical protein